MTTVLAADPRLDRGMGLLQATATNMLGMIGVGPFLTIPFMITAMGGPHILYAWLAGAVLALCDGLVYAQLGAALPGSGGPYVYLREAYKPFRVGRLMAFVFIFQTVVIGPLGIARGAVGFADYLRFYWTTMGPLEHNLMAAGLCVAITATRVSRRTPSIGATPSSNHPATLKPASPLHGGTWQVSPINRVYPTRSSSRGYAHSWYAKSASIR